MPRSHKRQATSKRGDNASTAVNFGNSGNFGNLGNAVFVYSRRVQFAETDLAGIVHFSWMFRYMEEAEHAWWRAAGLSVAEQDGEIGWPRVAASFEFRNPLRFEDLFEVRVRLASTTRRTLTYEHTIVRGAAVIGTGIMTAVCVRKRAGAPMRASELPPDLVDRLRTAAASGRSADVPR